MKVSSLSESQKGVAALIALAWVFGTMGVFVRYLDTSFGLFEQTYLRIALAFVLGIIFFSRSIRWQKFRTLPFKDAGVLVFRAVTLYLGVVLFTESILTTHYANASFVASFPFLPVLGYLLLRERLKARTLVYIVVGFVGVSIFSISNLATLTVGHGELMAFLSMFAFDFSYIARKWHSDHLNNKESTIFMFAVGALFLFATSLALGESLPTLSDFTATVVWALLGGAVFNVLNLYLTNYGFERVKVGVAGNILTLEVVFALLYSIFLFGEAPLLRELIGGALIVFSVYMVNRSEST